MKKNYFCGILVIMMVALLSINFVSCKNDDDNGGPGSKALVGSWKLADADFGYDLLVFKADGKADVYEYHLVNGQYVLDDEDHYTYTYDENTKILKTISTIDGDVDTYIVTFISPTQISIDGDIYIKQ